MSLSSINFSTSIHTNELQSNDTIELKAVAENKTDFGQEEAKSADAKDAQAGLKDAMQAAGDIFKNLTNALSEGMSFLSKIADIAKSVMGKAGG